MKLLIVDDSMIIRKAIQKFASKKKFQVIGEAVNGIEALKIFQQERPHVVTMDISMPEMDGLECIKRMVQIDEKIKIIAITALVAQESMLDAMNVGAKGFIQKPFNDEKLEKAFQILSES